MDTCTEEFNEEVRKAKEGDLPVTVEEDINLNLQGCLNYEDQTSIAVANGNDLINKWSNNVARQVEKEGTRKLVENVGRSIE